jgi:formylglycine-generating enzyme required for sulfatase activity
MDRVEQFFQKWFVDEKKALPSNASRLFKDTAEFEEMLETHLRELIRLKIGSTQGRINRHYHGNPFRGLLAFEPEDAVIFFGRTRACNELRELLARQARRGSGFVLVFGASGSGKSSLVKAGLLPDLILPGMIERVALVRCAVLRPSDRSGNLIEALAAAIIESKDALPELSAPPLNDTIESLSELLRDAPGQAARPIRQGLAAAGQAARLSDTAEARLLVIIDQLEELFTQDKVTGAERETFVAALTALAKSGVVWVIATMRSDFFDRLETLPALASLSGGGARFLLLPPDAAEIGQIIRQPAREAGLLFEIDPSSGIALDEIIRQDAMRDANAAPIESTSPDETQRSNIDKPAPHRMIPLAPYLLEKFRCWRNRRTEIASVTPGTQTTPILLSSSNQAPQSEAQKQVPHGALPLLSFLLDQLWRRRNANDFLTIGAYRELGGLKGAIGRRAEEVFLAQRQAVQNEFVPVLRELVTVTGGTATARSAPLSNFPKGSPRRELVEALLDKAARLLVADGDSGGAQVRLAHEALLTHWPRARDQVTADARDLELRGRLEQEAKRWRAASRRDKKSLVRAAGLPLAEALALRARWGAGLQAEITEFVVASRLAARNKLIRMGAIVAGAVAALPVIAALVWAGWVWWGVRTVENAMPFVSIPAGCFSMGSPLSDDERGPREGVDGIVPGFCLKTFDLGVNEVTQQEWRLVMVHNPAPSSFTGDRNPVESVSWNEAKLFIRFMNVFGRKHYRLASEAEWEYAARGHTTPTPYMKRYWGDRAEDGCAYENMADLSLHQRYIDYRYANCTDDYVNTAPVGSFKANPFGLHDMLGNVAEWVEDCFVQDLRQLPKDGTPAEQTNCAQRVLRGSSWGEPPNRLRAANRVIVEPGHRDNFYGFRIVRSP